MQLEVPGLEGLLSVDIVASTSTVAAPSAVGTVARFAVEVDGHSHFVHSFVTGSAATGGAPRVYGATLLRNRLLHSAAAGFAGGGLIVVP